MRRQTVAQLAGDLASRGEHVRRERCQFVSILLVARKGEHLGAQPHKLYAVLVVPLQHLDNVARVGETEVFHVLLAAFDIGGLLPVWSILGDVLGLVWVRERMPMLDDGCYATCP